MKNNAHDIARSLIIRHQRAIAEQVNHGGDDTHQSNIKIVRRNGKAVPWNRNKIEVAVRKAFLALHLDSDPAARGRRRAHPADERERAGLHLDRGPAGSRAGGADAPGPLQGRREPTSSTAPTAPRSAKQEKAEDAQGELEGMEQDPNQDSLILVKREDETTYLWDGQDLRKRIQYRDARARADLQRGGDREGAAPLGVPGDDRGAPRAHHHPQRQEPDREGRRLLQVRRPHHADLHLRGGARLEHPRRRHREIAGRAPRRVQEEHPPRDRDRPAQPDAQGLRARQVCRRRSTRPPTSTSTTSASRPSTTAT